MVRKGVALAVGAVALVALLVAEGLLPAAWLPLEEAAVAEQARGEPAAPGTTVSGLYPLLVNPLASSFSGETLVGAARLLNACLWAGLAVPTFLLARARASLLVASVAAAASALLPAAVYASTLAPDALATLLVAIATALFAHPRTHGRGLALAGSFACALAAAALRPWFAVVPLGLLVAYALPRVPWSVLKSWPRPLALALLAGIAVTGVAGISPELERATLEPWKLARAVAATSALGAIGMALIPWILAWAQVARARTDPLVAFLVTVGPALAVAGGVAAIADGGLLVDERPIVALAPAVMALAAGAWRGLAVSNRAFVLAAGVTASTMVFLPAPIEDPTLTGAPGLALLWSVLTELVGAGFLFALLTIGLAFAIAGSWRHPYVWGLAAAALLATHMAAWREAEHTASAFAATLPDAAWVDAHVEASGDVTLLDATRDLTPTMLAQLALSNRSVGPWVPVDPGAADESTGDLRVVVATPFALGHGIDVAGSTIARGPLGALVRIKPPPRVAYLVEGVDADGWMGSQALYRRFDSPRPGVVRLTLGRRAWGGPDVPGRVSVRTLAEGRVAHELTWTIHSSQERIVDLDVPAGRFEIDISVDPTFSPAAFGSPDSRQLGAQVAFDYRPGA
jgi:hypothetical protein